MIRSQILFHFAYYLYLFQRVLKSSSQSVQNYIDSLSSRQALLFDNSLTIYAPMVYYAYITSKNGYLVHFL